MKIEIKCIRMKTMLHLPLCFRMGKSKVTANESGTTSYSYVPGFASIREEYETDSKCGTFPVYQHLNFTYHKFI